MFWRKWFKKEQSKYKLGKKSLKKLQGVHPELVKVVKKAIQITEVDFTITDGVRTVAQQKALFNKGASKCDGRNKKSKHQIQSTGYGHAVDLVPYINGQPRWEMGACIDIAKAMSEASKQTYLPIRWGGSWSNLTSNFNPQDEMAEYTDRKRKQGSVPFLDGPHFELIRGV